MNWPAISYVSKKQAGRMVFGGLILEFLYRFLNHGFISQLHQPVIKFISADNTFWLFHLLNIPQTIIRSKHLTIGLEISLIIFLILSFWKPLSRIFPLLFLVLFTLFYITFQSYSGSHTHGELGWWLFVLPFLTKTNKSFYYLLKAVRYYFIFAVASAGLWKLFRANVFIEGSMVNILKQQLAHKLSNNFDGFTNQISYFLLSHPNFAQWLLYGVVLIQCFFIVGFITSKFDKLLFMLAIVFFTSNVFVMNIVSFEFIFLLLALIPFSKKFESSILQANQSLEQSLI